VPQPPRAAAEAAAAARTRVFVVSDLHTDYQENMDWVRRLAAGVGTAPGAAGEGAVNALVVAGDVAETRDNFARTMGALRDQFDAVFYVPGNHDLWLRREGGRYVSRFPFLCLALPQCLTKCLSIVLQPSAD
jgi:3',5'-cyclic AMP phosphodiesterase CpdA